MNQFTFKYIATCFVAGFTLCLLCNYAYAQQAIKDCKKCIIMADQSKQRVAIADVSKKAIIWEWEPANSNVKTEYVKWFSSISEAKPVYNMQYVLVTASGGGVALVRIADKKAVFYAYAGGNTHSAEVLPDGNIVSASSTGQYLTIFKVDTLVSPDKVYSKKIDIEFGHNVVWDNSNKVLWSAAMNKLKAFKYNFNCGNPDLELVETIDLLGTESHDLFPVYHENKLWLTDTSAIYTFDPATKKIAKTNFSRRSIKSISSGPSGFPVILSEPKEKWWTDAVIDIKGNTVFEQNGLKLYKARWFLPNSFSYPLNDAFKQCK
ncbi:DUF6528 family protein [Mucilaginibacter sabulilitoris]|uniref:DUF6528 family protein n=1 Tax=Mucilaginibacter sabulilitoris TaxID=1173583 RepID=A0ABZ0TMF5_9SPHI|nr:DUF6528 family protein [Mucilaginibacter sabulilitoris]WPU92720.1 DUF6528 family protein [Mucilaginibacter sabulilitoris]